MSLLEVLNRWNKWGTAELNAGIERDITPKILQTINLSQVIVLTGPRRAGKSTILYQVINYLQDTGIDPRAVLHVNFEDPGLALELEVDLLDQIYNTYRTHIYPEGKAYIFFDEIQRVASWERWVRARNETENVKIFITGSSAQLMSRELATLLTGRHLSFTILPLNFNEFLRFNKIDVPKIHGNIAPVTIRNALLRYITWGGYPSIVLIDDEKNRAVDNMGNIKQQLLLEYFDDILFKDVALRHQIRDLNLLRNLAIHLLTQTGGLITYKKLAGIFSVTSDVIQNYVQYLQEAYLIDLIPFFSHKIAERNRNPQKLHVVDLGIRNLIAMSNSDNIGRNIETLVYNNLNNVFDNIYYYKDLDGEIDLLTHRGNTVTQLIQVVHHGLDCMSTLRREIKPLIAARTKFPQAKLMLVVNEFPLSWHTSQEIANNEIEIIPLWKYLLLNLPK